MNLTKSTLIAGAKTAAKALTPTVRSNVARFSQGREEDAPSPLEEPKEEVDSYKTETSSTGLYQKFGASLADIDDSEETQYLQDLQLPRDDRKLSLLDLAARLPPFVETDWTEYEKADQRLVLRACLYWKELDPRIEQFCPHGTRKHRSTDDPDDKKEVWTLESQRSDGRRLTTYHLHEDGTYTRKHKIKPSRKYVANIFRTREPEELPNASDKRYYTKLDDRPVLRNQSDEKGPPETGK